MLRIPGFRFACIIALLFTATPASAQQAFKDRDDALLYIAKTMKAVETVSYEGSARLKYRYAMYVEDKRMVYVSATTGDTTYTVIPYEMIDFADTGRIAGRYLNLYTAFGAFTKFFSKTGNLSATSHAEFLMQDTAVYDTRRLMQAFDLAGRNGKPDTAIQQFNNPAFFRLRAYQQFPRYVLQDSTGKEFFLTDVIKKANKPAIVFTWAEWCPPCIRLFDSLVNSGINKDYSMVLIKKGPKENMGKRYKLPRGFQWWEQVMFLFDNGSVTDTLDQGSVPLIFWTDAAGNITREHSGFDISVNNARQILDAIKKQQLKPGPRYYSFFDTPVRSEAEARFKYTIERKDNRVRLNIYFRKLQQFVLKGWLDYRINNLGELQQVH